MQKVPKATPPQTAIHHTYKAGPFRTPVRPDDVNHARPRKRAPSPAVLVGEAGANLVVSRMQTWGIAANLAMPGVAYDAIADIPGFDLLRVQVKTKSKPAGRTCSFSLTRGYYYSRAGMFKYAEDDFDIAAFVVLDLGKVFFCAAPVHRINVRTEWLHTPGLDVDTFKIALDTVQRRRRLEALSWLSSMNKDKKNAPDSSNDTQDDFNF